MMASTLGGALLAALSLLVAPPMQALYALALLLWVAVTLSRVAGPRWAGVGGV